MKAQTAEDIPMDLMLDGSDWEAGYFLSEAEYDAWMKRSRTLHNQLLESARAAGINHIGGCAGDLMKASVPGCDRTVLLENGMIPDPFYGRNLEMSSWSEKRAWAFRKIFRIPEHLRHARQFRLHFKGIDYSAMFFLNDVFLGRHTGMFLPADFDVTGQLDRNGENCLAVIFDPAPQGLPNHQDEKPADFAAFFRVQSGFGWDWSRSIVPTGIWDSVILSASNTVRMRNIHWMTQERHVHLALDLEALADWNGILELHLAPDNFIGTGFERTEKLSLRHGENRCTLSFECPDARKWFPAGYGDPALYRLELLLDGRKECMTVGFRDLEMRRNPGSPEGTRNLTFTINGMEIFARGANWVPIDLLPSRATPQDYAVLTDLAAAAHFNMFRIWGGGLIEKEAFYDCCDRRGILVWQEFPHACSNYRKDAEYLALKAREASAILLKLRNHVSSALFCGGNEMQYYGEIPDSPLYQMYEKLTGELAPGIAFHTSSPDASRPGERPHGPWNYQEHAVCNRHFRQFASEIGCNAIPEEESLERFIPRKEKIPDGQSWRYHFLNLHGVNDIRIPLQKFDLSGRWEWSQASMFAQADAAGYIFEHYRRLFPRASGCLFWQFNEPWPTCAWSLADYYKIPKSALYRLAAANAPRNFSLEDQSWCLSDGIFQGTLWYCGDLDGFHGTLAITFFDGAGKVLLSETESVSVSAGVHRLKEVRCDCANAAYGIVLALIRASDEKGAFRGERLYGVPDFQSAFRLPEACLEQTLRQTGRHLELTIHNTGNIPALMVRAKLPYSSVWQENYCSPAPGERVVYRAELEENRRICPEEIVLSGWNFSQIRGERHESC